MLSHCYYSLLLFHNNKIRTVERICIRQLLPFCLWDPGPTLVAPGPNGDRHFCWSPLLGSQPIKYGTLNEFRIKTVWTNGTAFLIIIEKNLIIVAVLFNYSVLLAVCCNIMLWVPEKTIDRPPLGIVPNWGGLRIYNSSLLLFILVFEREQDERDRMLMLSRHMHRYEDR